MTAEATCTTPTNLFKSKLAKFSDRQRAVADTWAQHFEVRTELRERFLLDYLTYTSSSRCWCVPLDDDQSPKRRVLARFGNLLQYFDGQQISAVSIRPSHRIPTSAPTTAAALKIANRVMQGIDTCVAILTTFCKQARELSGAEAIASLGVHGKEQNISQEGRNKRYFGPRKRFYITAIGAALKRFCQCLDQEVLHAVRSAQCPSAELYNWLAEGSQSRRLQALKSQPVLIPLLVLGEQMPWPYSGLRNAPDICPWPELQKFCTNTYDNENDYNRKAGAGITGLIADLGLPLNKVLAWLFGQPVSSIRFLGQQRVYDTSSALTRFSSEGRDTGWISLMAGARLGNRRPVNKLQWRSFMKFREALPWQVGSFLKDLNKLLVGCPTDWTDDSWAQMGTKLSDLKEVFDNLDRVHNADVSATSQRLKEFIASLSFNQISSLIDEFHVALEQLRVELDAEYPQTETDSRTPWQGLLTDAVEIPCPNGLHIVELLCPQDLDEEHRKLGHCIDTYDYRAYLGNCRLLSAREENQPVASVEICLVRSPHDNPASGWSPKHLTTVQIRAAKNREPDKNSPAHKAYTWFFSELKNGRISINLDWPNQTLHMRRYADVSRKSRFAQILTRWINHYIDRGL